MRRIVFGLFAVVVVAGLLLTTGCSTDRALRITRINKGEPVVSDLVDFGEIRIEDEEGEVEIFQVMEVPSDIVEIEFQYVEIGLGLPTWTPYWANIEKATIVYTNQETGETYESVQVGMSAAVESDPEGDKLVRTEILIAPGRWKANAFEDELQEAPEDDEYGVVAMVTAHVIVEGHDYVSNQTVKAEKDVSIEFGNFYDEPSRLGQ
jgi:hypothetical protein